MNLPEDKAKLNCRENTVARAQGCLLGQLAGDALGSLVEFKAPDAIKREFPDGVREMLNGGTWNTLAGQPTDDSEMALILARTIVENKGYDPNKALEGYRFWIDSGPFDRGRTVTRGLRGEPDPNSQANGALMRISPLGIFGANHDLKKVAGWAMQDAALTHPHPICQQANALFAMAISYSVANGPKPEELYEQVLVWAEEISVEEPLMQSLVNAATQPPTDYLSSQGWVIIAFQNAFWQLLNASNLEEAVVNTVMRGGDTDTNAAICGALLGAVHGRKAIPEQWEQSVLSCRPLAGQPGVCRPRPEIFWPVDALIIAKELLGCS